MDDQATPLQPASIPCGLFLRPDGTLMLTDGTEKAIQIRLLPAQLLLLAGKAMSVAIALDPTLQAEINEAMAAWRSAAHLGDATCRSVN